MQPTKGLPAIDRRGLLRSAILLVGGSLAGLPGQALAQAADAAAATKRFFSAEQFATLAEAAEIMIPRTDTPGAKDAGVAESLDKLMSAWASAERRRQFAALIDELGASARAAGGTLASLSQEKRFEVVRAFDAEKLRAYDPVYTKFKELVLTLYYLSEAGATKELRYELVPGKWEPGIEVKTDTRAWAV
jgi:hypothetical protein